MVDIELTDLIDSLKEKVAEKIHRTPGNVRIIYKGKQLEDGRTLADYNIGKGDTVHAVPRV